MSKIWWPEGYLPTIAHMTDIVMYGASLDDDELMQEACELLWLLGGTAFGSDVARQQLENRQRQTPKPTMPGSEWTDDQRMDAFFEALRTGLPMRTPTGEGCFARMWHLGTDNLIEIPGGFKVPERLQAELGVLSLNLALGE